jgi:hypothetical protein
LTRPRRLSWRLLALLIVVLGVVFVIGVTVRFRNRRERLKADVQTALSQLDHDDPCWRLEDIEAARENVPGSENGASCVVAAAKLLPKSWPANEFYLAYLKLVPNEKLTAEQAERLSTELDAVRPAVTEARKLAAFPRGRHRLAYARNPINILLEDQQGTRTIATLLRFDVLDQCQTENPKAALTSCHAIVNAGRTLGDEPLVISQLIRMASINIACGATERALAQGEAAVADLAALQRALEVDDRHPYIRTFVRGKRANTNSLYEALERGDLGVSDLERGGPSSPSWEERNLGWRIRDNFRREHALMLDVFTERVKAADLPLHEQTAADERFDERIRGLPPGAILTRMMAPAMVKLGNVARRTHANLRCAAVGLATERYRRTHGKWPAKVTDLVPKFLPSVPLDPFDGKLLRYRRLADGVVICSVGADGVDDGGVLDRENPTRDDADLGFRQWDVTHHRLAPKAPAAAEPPEKPR